MKTTTRAALRARIIDRYIARQEDGLGGEDRAVAALRGALDRITPAHLRGTLVAYIYLTDRSDPVGDAENGPSPDDIIFPQTPRQVWHDASGLHRKALQGIYGMHPNELPLPQSPNPKH